jgi:3D (Asp-Asp-Asp) domain-containing protein
VGSFSRQALSLVLLLGGCGHESSVVEDSLDMLVVPDAAGRSTDAATDAGLGTLKGSMVLTYYWVTMQADYTGPNDTVICDAKALSLATVPLAFAQALALEGTGRLSDGRLLNVSGACTCSSGMHTCYSVLDPLKYPFGEGVGSRALRPYRSIAVDRSFFAIGTKLYVPELLGEPMPQSYGFVHDGCLSADDVGGGITGAHIDWFVAEKANYRTLDAQLKLSQVAAYVNSPHCP